VCGEGDEQPTRVSPSTPPSLPLTCDDGYATALNRLRSQSCKLSTPHDIAASQHLSKTIANNDFDFHIQFKNALIITQTPSPLTNAHRRGTMEASTASREELSKLVKVYFVQLTKGEWE
jgi:hypothetical protein